MTFKEDEEKDDKCPECGSTVIFIYGDMWDNDRAYCSNFNECSYEVEYDSTTVQGETET